MALSLLDGSNANIDITIASNSLRCWTNYWSADIVRDFSEATTFCSAGWRARLPGMKQLIGAVDGFSAKGTAGTNPATYFASTATQAYVLTADTGCTFTFDGHVGRHHTGLRASANSEMAMNFESYGAVTVAWIVT